MSLIRISDITNSEWKFSSLLPRPLIAADSAGIIWRRRQPKNRQRAAEPAEIIGRRRRRRNFYGAPRLAVIIDQCTCVCIFLLKLYYSFSNYSVSSIVHFSVYSVRSTSSALLKCYLDLVFSRPYLCDSLAVVMLVVICLSVRLSRMYCG